MTTTTVRPETARAWRNPASLYTLTYDDVDDQHPGCWVLRRADRTNPDEVVETVHRWDEPMTSGEAMTAAISLLYAHQVRVTGWTTYKHRDSFLATVGVTHDSWQVLEYEGRGGTRWRRGADGAWTGRGSSRYGNEDLLRRAQGPLTPITVHNVAGLVAELMIYRAAATYFIGPDACAEGDCEEYDTLPDGALCSHIETRVATGQQALALDRVRELLDELDTTSPTDSDTILGLTPGELIASNAIRDTVKAIRRVIAEETEET